MKTMKILLSLSLVLIVSPVLAQPTVELPEPGWVSGYGPVLPVPGPGQLVLPGEGQGKPSKLSAQGTVQLLAEIQSYPSVAEVITPELYALAQNLQNDPKRIFDYVRNEIRYVHYFGCKKGAHLTMLERSGNDFDQCTLLVALLRAADANNPAVTYTVSYDFGMMTIPWKKTDGTPDLKGWLGFTAIGDTDWFNAWNALNVMNLARGFPLLGTSGDSNQYKYWVFTPVSGPASYIMPRVTVVLQIGANTYRLDPSLKLSTFVPGIDLATAMGFNLDNVLTAAKSGAAVDPNYVQNVNYNQVKNLLNTYTGNLLQVLTNTSPNRTVEEVISGYRIVETETTALPTALPYAYAPVPFETALAQGTRWVTFPNQQWDNIPPEYMTTLRINGANLDHTYYFAELRGQKLSLTFVSQRARLSLDDVLSVNASSDCGATPSITVTINHPFGTWNYGTPQHLDDDPTRVDPANVNTTTYQRAALGYVIVYGFGDPDQRLVARQKKLETLLRQYPNIQPTDPNFPKVVTETLEVMGLSWVQQCSLIEHAMLLPKDLLAFTHNRCGRAGHGTGTELGYFVDLPLNYSADVWRAGNPIQNPNYPAKAVESTMGMSSALEHGIIEQLQGNNPSASTVKCLYTANSGGYRTILANSANWTTVDDYLSANYAPADIAAFGTLVTAGHELLLHNNGQVAIGANWKGYGYYDRLESSATLKQGMIIKGGYPLAGGYAGNQSYIVPSYTSYEFLTSPTYYAPSLPSAPSLYSWDPVDMSDGSFVVDTTHLVSGQAEPRGYSFSSHYSSNRRYTTNDSGMAHGWTHNYVINAAERSDALAGLGKNTPQEMASALVGAHVAREVYSRTPDTGNPKVLLWTVAMLIGEYTIDQLTDNAVNITMGSKSVQFIKQPTGSSTTTYVPSAGVTMSLRKSGANYVLQQRHANTLNFDSSNRLSTIVDPYGKIMTFTYVSSTDNRLDLVTDAFNRKLDFVYDGTTKRLITVHDNDGSANQRSVSFGYATTYNADGDITGLTDPENKTSTFEYDSEHKILKTKDAMATPRVIVQNIYDTYGRVTEQLCEGDSARRWQLFYGGRVSVEMNPQGGCKTFYYDDKFRAVGTKDALGNRTRITYDGQDHVTRQITPKGEISDFQWDAYHNLTRFKEAILASGTGINGSGSGTTFTGPASFDFTTKSAVGDMLEMTSGTSAGTAVRITAITDATHVQYTPSATLASGEFTVCRTAYRFYEDGPKHLTRIRDYRGQDTVLTYDAYHQVTSITSPNVNNDPAMPCVVEFGYYASDVANGKKGNLEWQEDEDNNRVYFQYDQWGQVTRRTLPDDGDPSTLEYERFVNNYRGDVTMHTDFRDHATTFQYNKRRQMTLKSEPGNSGAIVTQYEYDNPGNLWKVTDPRSYITEYLYNAGGKLMVTRFPAIPGLGIPEVENHYDNRNWLEWTENPLNERITYIYDAAQRLTGVRDPLLHTTSYGYDANSERTTVTSPLPANPPITTTSGFNARGESVTLTDSMNPGNVIKYQYDANSNPTKVLNRNNGAFVSTYYNNNQLETFETPLHKIAQMTYVKRGMPYTVREPSNQLTTFGYDNRGQLKNLTDDVTGGTPASFTYDGNGNLLTHVEGTTTITRGYDNLNRVTSYSYTDSANPTHNYILGYQFDGNGNLTQITYPGGKAVNYVYDSNNRLSTLTDWNSRVTAYTYDLAGRVKEIARPNGTKRKVTYDAAGQATLIQEVPANAGAIAYFRVNYYEDSTIKDEFIAPIPTVYTEPSLTMTPNADNQIATFNGQGVTHDNDGNMTVGPLNTSPLVTYSYNSRNLLTGVGNVSYTYDPEGNRITLTQSGQAMRFATGAGNLLVRTRPDGTKTFYVYGHGLLYDVEMTAAGDDTGVSHTYHYDFRGSTVAITDCSASVLERIQYSVYGRIASRTGTQVDTPFLYSGGYGVQTDPNSLLYMRARYYNPYICRFINADPAGFDGGMNFYAYADGDPVSKVDPSGLGSYMINDILDSMPDYAAEARREEMLIGMINLATFGLADSLLGTVTGRTLNGSYIDRALAFENTLKNTLNLSLTALSVATGAWSAQATAIARAGTVNIPFAAQSGVAATTRGSIGQIRLAGNGFGGASTITASTGGGVPSTWNVNFSAINATRARTIALNGGAISGPQNARATYATVMTTDGSLFSSRNLGGAGPLHAEPTVLGGLPAGSRPWIISSSNGFCPGHCAPLIRSMSPLYIRFPGERVNRTAVFPNWGTSTR